MNYMISVAGEIHLPFIPVNEFDIYTRMLLDYDQHYYVRPVSIEDIDRLLISCSSDLQLYAIISHIQNRYSPTGNLQTQISRHI